MDDAEAKEVGDLGATEGEGSREKDGGPLRARFAMVNGLMLLQCTTPRFCVCPGYVGVVGVAGGPLDAGLELPEYTCEQPEMVESILECGECAYREHSARASSADVGGLGNSNTSSSPAESDSHWCAKRQSRSVPRENEDRGAMCRSETPWRRFAFMLVVFVRLV